MKNILLIFSISMIFSPLMSQAGWQWESLSVQKDRAKKHLETRKKGFDQYQKLLEQREKRRFSDAHKQKDIRKKHGEQREKARRGFVRQIQPFPRSAYKAFLKKREGQRKDIERARSEYSTVKKALRNLEDDKRYKIDGNKEFKL